MVFLVETIYKGDDIYLQLFSRRNGKKEVDIVKDFIPYFYVTEETVVADDNRILKIQTGHVDLLGKKLKKIFVKNYNHVKELSEMYPDNREADINYNQRYIVDVLGEVKTYPLKTLYFDIETNATGKFPDIDRPDQEIVCISLVDDMDNVNKVLFLANDKNRDKIPKLDYLQVYNTEEELLYAFIKEFNEIDPDIISGWNIEGFDLRYLIRRMEQFNIDTKLLSPLKSVRIYKTKDGEKVNIKGRIVMDMQDSYEYFRKISNQGKAESYSLEFTAQSILGKGKIKMKDKFATLWNNDPAKFIEYNLRDSLLVKELNDKVKIIEFFNTIRAKSCAQLRDITSTSRLIDGLLLRKAKDRVVLPTAHHSESDMFSGATVIPPIAGLYNNVLGLDILSDYPNIIKTFNISYETYDMNGDIKLTEDACFKQGFGLIPEVIVDLEKERKHNKKLMKEATTKEDKEVYHFRQYAVKVLMNSMFGYLGYSGSRLYKKEIANAITTMGRNVLFFTKAEFESKGFKIVYGDTDSLYVQSNQTETNLILMEGAFLRDYINERFKSFAKSYGAERCSLEIEFEKVFKKILFVAKRGEEEGAKKKYAYMLLWTEKEGHKALGTIDMSGFETVRSDTPRIGRLAQKTVLEMIMQGSTKDEIVNYIKGLDKQIRKKEIPEEEYAFPKGISGNILDYGIKEVNGKKVASGGIPPVITGARYSNKYLGTQFEKGSKPKWTYVKSVPPGYPNTSVITFEEFIPQGFLPDYDLICEKIFKAKLEAIFEAAGLGKFPEINAEKTSLDRWFGVKQ